MTLEICDLLILCASAVKCIISNSIGNDTGTLILLVVVFGQHGCAGSESSLDAWMVAGQKQKKFDFVLVLSLNTGGGGV